MKGQDNLNYQRIAHAIDYIRNNFRNQPNLDEVAREVNLSPFHFQKLFTEWAGVSPKQFLQFISVEYAKNILKNEQATVFETAYQTGLSGTGRLHDLFIKIEAMTPGEYKNGGESLAIGYGFIESQFGKMITASTEKGICHMAFADDVEKALCDLRNKFPKALFKQENGNMFGKLVSFFDEEYSSPEKIKLHLKGTDFQIRVWQTLLSIPLGKLTSYGNIAKHINKPRASRAVGTAIGDNPIAYIIPCHRVIQSTGVIGQYHWGTTRKNAIIGWEGAAVRIKR